MTTSTTSTTTPTDAEIKARHRALWTSGDYAGIADDVIPDLGAVLVDACDVRAGERVLDVAAGTGNAALPAARRGATVTATDLAPALLDVGRARAEAQGLRLTWQEADAEAMPHADASFDVVLSCVGVMFAPHHRATADELVRLTRPGGRIGLVSWTPEGFVGRMFAAMKPYAPPPPPGAQPPPLWGRDEHVRELLGDRVTDVVTRRATVPVGCYATGEDFREDFKARYGPTLATYRRIADAPEQVATLDRELAALAEAHDLGGGAMEWEYLLVTARRRDG